MSDTAQAVIKRGVLLNLPQETLLHIVNSNKLSYFDLKNLRNTCHALRTLLNDSAFDKKLFREQTASKLKAKTKKFETHPLLDEINWTYEDSMSGEDVFSPPELAGKYGQRVSMHPWTTENISSPGVDMVIIREILPYAQTIKSKDGKPVTLRELSEGIWRMWQTPLSPAYQRMANEWSGDDEATTTYFDERMSQDRNGFGGWRVYVDGKGILCLTVDCWDS